MYGPIVPDLFQYSVKPFKNVNTISLLEIFDTFSSYTETRAQKHRCTHSSARWSVLLQRRQTICSSLLGQYNGPDTLHCRDRNSPAVSCK